MAKNPVHKLVTDYLTTDVLPGLDVGDELPTIRELCDRFNVGGVQTIRDGMQPLIDAGYVETRFAPTRRWVVKKRLPIAGSSSSSVLDQLQAELAAARDALSAAIATVGQLRRAA